MERMIAKKAFTIDGGNGEEKPIAKGEEFSATNELADRYRSLGLARKKPESAKDKADHSAEETPAEPAGDETVSGG